MPSIPRTTSFSELKKVVRGAPVCVIGYCEVVPASVWPVREL